MNLWEKNSSCYDDEIFDVLHNDKKSHHPVGNQKILFKKQQTVIDIGLWPLAKWLPGPLPRF